MAEKKSPSIPGVIAYFTVSDSKAATAFYDKAFGAKLIDRRETPDGRSMHVHVEITGGSMMFNDPPLISTWTCMARPSGVSLRSISFAPKAFS